MDRIYSRWRIRIPKIKEKRNRKKLKIIVIFIIAILTVIVSIRAVNPIFEKMSEAEAKAIATKISNEKATEVMANYKYQDLVTIMKDNNGNITAITSNIIPINEIISDVAVKIQEELDKVELNEINITKINLQAVSSRITKEKIAVTEVKIEVENIEELNKVLKELRKVDSVYEVTRKK